jgi:hypothetical protein
MALNGATNITVTKIMNGKTKAYTYNGTGKDIILISANIKSITGTGDSNEDSLYELTDGTLLWGVESYSDTSTELSASDRTGS